MPYPDAPKEESISIHAPPRGATRQSWRKIFPTYFNSRPSARGDKPEVHTPAPFINFNSRPSARGDGTIPERQRRHLCYFNSRPSARGDAHADALPVMQVYFNSRPSARGDGKRYAISANLLFNPYKSAWLNNSATQFVEIILVIFHRIIA